MAARVAPGGSSHRTVGTEASLSPDTAHVHFDKLSAHATAQPVRTNPARCALSLSKGPITLRQIFPFRPAVGS